MTAIYAHDIVCRMLVLAADLGGTKITAASGGEDRLY
jgi:hypothetical protein